MDSEAGVNQRLVSTFWLTEQIMARGTTLYESQNNVGAFTQLFTEPKMWYTHSLWSLYILLVETAYC